MTSHAVSLFNDDALASPHPPHSPLTVVDSSWERGAIFIDRFISWCGSVDVERVPVEVAVEMISTLGHMSNAINGLRLALTATVDRVTSPPSTGEKPVKGKARPIPGDHPDLTGLLSAGTQPRHKARDEISQARAIRDSYPLFGSELRHGRISPAHIDVLNRRIPAELVQRAQSAEATLLEYALQGTFEQFVKLVRGWVVRYAPLRAEKKAREEARREKFTVFRSEGGYKLSGWLNAINGIHLDKALRALVGVPPVGDRREFAERNADALVAILNGEEPRAVSTIERKVTREGAGGVGSRAQRRPVTGHNPRTHILVHVPLATLVQTEKAIESGCSSLAQVEHTPAGRAGGSRPRNSQKSLLHDTGGEPPPGNTNRQTRTHTSMTPPCGTTGAGLGRRGQCLDDHDRITAQLGRVLAHVRAGIDASMLDGFAPATLEDGTALAPSQLAAMLCDSRISRVVLTAHGEPLDASRAQRLFSATQAKAILARDRTCRYPGCDRGIEVGEIHHAQQWDEGGTTTVDNAVLLCWRHHQTVHQNNITIHHHTGGFIFTKPDRTVLGIRKHENMPMPDKIVAELEQSDASSMR